MDVGRLCFACGVHARMCACVTCVACVVQVCTYACVCVHLRGMRACAQCHTGAHTCTHTCPHGQHTQHMSYMRTCTTHASHAHMHAYMNKYTTHASRTHMCTCAHVHVLHDLHMVCVFLCACLHVLTRACVACGVHVLTCACLTCVAQHMQHMSGMHT